MEFGVRLNNRMYVKFDGNLETGDIDVGGTIVLEDGTVADITGKVVWEVGD